MWTAFKKAKHNGSEYRKSQASVVCSDQMLKAREHIMQ